MDKGQELRGWKAHCVDLQDRLDRLELENSRLKAAIDAANAQEPVYQWRIDGDEGWIDCTKEWFDEIYYTHENRILYARPIPAQQSIEQSHMAGQSDAGVDPSYSNAHAYAISAQLREDRQIDIIPFARQIERAVIDRLSKQAAPVSDGLPEQWRLAGPGQIKSGDVIIMTTAGRRICKTAKEVLHAGTREEEVIYNKKKNHYFITRMVLDGTSYHKDVYIVPENICGG